MLAVALAKPSNLMILDEPTNDLDLETLDLLQDMLAEYQGTVLLVSHDRDFLDRVATSTVAAEGDGRWVEYAGGYSDMLSQRGEVVTEAAKPGRSRAALPQTSADRPARPRLSFKDQHALKTLPAEIDRLHARIGAHQAVLAEPGLFTRDVARFRSASAALEADMAALAAAEEKWLALEMMREEIEG
jgi:ATP-binding cassette subfamily F protein uup